MKASTGFGQGALKLSGFTSTLIPAPSGTHAIRIAADSKDRIQLLSLHGASNFVLDDRPSSLERQSDGPYHLEILPDGSALIAGCQSYNIRTLNTASGQETGYTSTSTTLVETLLRGKHVVVPFGAVDLTGTSALFVYDSRLTSVEAVVALPSPADELQPAPAPTQAWARTGGSTPGLALVDTDPAVSAVLTFVPLASNASKFENWERLFNRSSDGQSFAVGSSLERAFAVSKTNTGTVLEVLDLELQQVVGVTTIPTQVEGRPDVRVSPDVTRLYVSTSAAEIFAFDVSTNQPSLLWNQSCIPSTSNAPIQLGHLELSPSGELLLATLGPWSNPALGCPQTVALEAATGDIVQILDLPVDTLNIQRVGDVVLRISRSKAEILREQSGGFVVTKTLTVPAAEGEVALDRVRGRLLVPNSLDELYVFDLSEDQITSACSPAAANATGQPAHLTFEGSPFAGDALTVRTHGLLPGGMLGYLVVGDQTVAPTAVAGSPSPLCIGGSLGRLTSQVQNADQSGVQTFAVDTKSLPVRGGPVSVQPGETWTFQSWYQDSDPAGMPRSNFSDALAVTFL